MQDILYESDSREARLELLNDFVSAYAKAGDINYLKDAIRRAREGEPEITLRQELQGRLVGNGRTNPAGAGPGLYTTGESDGWRRPVERPGTGHQKVA
ncbi:MAG: hypothetical protein GDA53_08645 [Rhodobacteraceae bacterium]|nr:hypothetical protein [Paracoccaceae bacterium]